MAISWVVFTIFYLYVRLFLALSLVLVKQGKIPNLYFKIKFISSSNFAEFEEVIPSGDIETTPKPELENRDSIKSIYIFSLSLNLILVSGWVISSIWPTQFQLIGHFTKSLGVLDSRTPNLWVTRVYYIQCRLLCSIFCNRSKVRLILICASHIVIADNDSRLSGILPNEVTMNQVKAFKLKYHKEVYIQKRRLSMPGQSILFDD